jgi:hypothetical protein
MPPPTQPVRRLRGYSTWRKPQLSSELAGSTPSGASVVETQCQCRTHCSRGPQPQDDARTASCQNAPRTRAKSRTSATVRECPARYVRVASTRLSEPTAAAASAVAAASHSSTCGVGRGEVAVLILSITFHKVSVIMQNRRCQKRRRCGRGEIGETEVLESSWRLQNNMAIQALRALVRHFGKQAVTCHPGPHCSGSIFSMHACELQDTPKWLTSASAAGLSPSSVCPLAPRAKARMTATSPVTTAPACSRRGAPVVLLGEATPAIRAKSAAAKPAGVAGSCKAILLRARTEAATPSIAAKPRAMRRDETNATANRNRRLPDRR